MDYVLKNVRAKKRIDHIMNYSPLIPRNEIKTRALFKDFDSKFTGKLPKPVLMKCYNTKAVCHWPMV